MKAGLKPELEEEAWAGDFFFGASCCGSGGSCNIDDIYKMSLKVEIGKNIEGKKQNIRK